MNFKIQILDTFLKKCIFLIYNVILEYFSSKCLILRILIGNINYIKALQSYEDQNYESVQSHGQTLLSQIPENTWRWPLVKQRSDIELLLNIRINFSINGTH